MDVDPQVFRWNLLVQCLQEIGVSSSYQKIETQDENFEEVLGSVLKKRFVGIRIGSIFGERLMQSFPQEPALLLSIGSADTLIKIHNQWWPRSLLYEALHYLLGYLGKEINFTSSALIVGAGSEARVAIAVLLKMGFKSFKITHRFADQGISLLAELKRIYFNVTFEYIPVNQLIMLPAVHSIMINTLTDEKDHKEVIPELLYFNFLEPGGEIWDFSMGNKELSLATEAQQIGTKYVSGCEVASWVDFLWCKHVFKKSFNKEKYKKLLMEER